MTAIWLFFSLIESIVDIMSKDKKRFIQRKNNILIKKCIEKLQEFNYFERSNLPCAADDAAEVMSKPRQVGKLPEKT